ncbi:MAG: hypothetical protein ACLUZ6_02505 [Lachnospira eligens]
MRLIDADKLIDFIDPGHLRQPDKLCFSEIDVVNMINHTPTAYDVDEVLRQLDEEKNFRMQILTHVRNSARYKNQKKEIILS